MSDSRTRRPSASTSASTPRAQGVRLRLADRSPRSGSGTPMFEDDDEDKPKRSTRGRNPLPPSSGPLFPPLPPKMPKSRISGASYSSALDEPMDSPSPSEKPDLPTTSNASLTPPPPGSEDVLDDEDEEVGAEVVDAPLMEAGEGQGNDADEDTGETQRGRSTSIQPKLEDGPSVKAEEGEADGSERARSQSRAKRRRGEEALLLDDHLLPPEVRRISQSTSRRGSRNVNREDLKVPAPPEPAAVEEDIEMPEVVDGEDEIEEAEQEAGEEEGADDWDEGDGQDITRCACTNDASETELMIQCDKCNVWQHGPCMGIWSDDEAPDEYFCEKCRPDLHVPLRRYLRKIGRAALGKNFEPPTLQELKSLRPYNDQNHPSQSTRWLDPTFLRTPTPPPKPASRSHHKKEVEPSGDVNDGRRSGRRLPFPERPATKPGRKEKDKDKEEDKEKEKEEKGNAKQPHLPKRRSSIGHDSASPNRSLSPSAHMHSAARRRITMNSRDAMYEEEVKAAMEASRREALGLSPVPEPVVDEAMEEEEVEKTEVKKGKRKRDREEEEGLGDHTGPSGKAKHPNQYTYRPKPPSSSTQPVSAPSPARRGAGTPVPAPTIAPPQHEHGTRRAGAIANGAIAYPNLSASSVASLNWYTPDHLSAYSDLLPTPQPVALDVRSQRTLPNISRNHHHNQRYGPFNENRDESGRLILPEDIPMREPTDEATTHLEPPARVRYPAKRITVGEIRKRVRSMLDYVAKVQSADEKRIERNKALGIVVKPLPKKVKAKESSNDPGEADTVEHNGGEEDGQAGGDGDIEMDAPDVEAGPSNTNPDINPNGDAVESPDPPASPPPRSSTELMEELTRELLAFQETFVVPNGYSSPMPPPMPTFEQPLAVPATEETEPEPESEVLELEPPSSALTGTDMGTPNGHAAEGGLDSEVFESTPTQTPNVNANDATAIPDPNDFVTPDRPTPGSSSLHLIHEMLNRPGPLAPATPAPAAMDTELSEPTNGLGLGSPAQLTGPPPPEPMDEIPGSNSVPSDEVVIEDTTTLDVYRAGQVDKVVITGEEERDVVDSLAPEPTQAAGEAIISAAEESETEAPAAVIDPVI